jgi:exonuclease SbcC
LHVATARAAAATLPVKQAARQALAALRPPVVEHGLVANQVRRLDEEQRSAREIALSLEHKALDLRVASVNTMIARLAGHLQDGLPCEVCGSPDHPDPSSLRDEGVSSDDEAQARADADAAQQHVSDLQAQLAGARATHDALGAQVGELTLESLDRQVAELDLELDLLTSTASRLPEMESLAEDVEAQRQAAAQNQVAATSQAAAAARRCDSANARAALAAAQLRAVLGDELDLVAAISGALDRAAAAQEALEAARHRQALSEELDRLDAAAQLACHNAGFASSEAALSAVRDVEWVTATTSQLRAAADVAAAVAAELADPELDVDLSEPAPVAAATAAVAEADTAVSAAERVLGDRRQRVAALDRLVPQLQQLLGVLEPLEQEATRVRCLADLCNGGGANTLKMTLASFVLAARLEQVAAVASGRLLRMTEGRYSLVHTDGTARGGARSGLGLLVRDTWTGQDRDTATLSGGETFLAALALALGLADVVTAEAGGARIGALFVDEGFGMLDEDSLDEVMDVLDGLREGGRVVGLVSHVAELKQRIPAQIVVSKTRAGSALTLRGC